MATLDDLKAKESAAERLARQRLSSRVTKSEEEQNRVLTQMMEHVIVDKLVYPQALNFIWIDNQLQVRFHVPLSLPGKKQDNAERYRTHNHAIGQMADVSGLTRTFLRRLEASDEEWMHDLLCYNFDELFGKGKFVDRKGERKRFLVRLVGNQIRGFLSQNFNRKLTTAPLLRAFIEECRALYAGPVSVTTTDVRVYVQYMLPYVFEPVDGEFVSFGVAFGNSDFGCGKLTVSGVILRSASNTTTVLSDKYSRTHLGSVIQDSDIEMSKDTADKELDTVRSAIRDAVQQLLGQAAIKRYMTAIQTAHEKQIPWYKLKNRLTGTLTKDEVKYLEFLLSGSSPVTDLPPVETLEDAESATPTAWWAANAVGSLAVNNKDPDRKAELEAIAGSLFT